jgi:hypothetical protein
MTAKMTTQKHMINELAGGTDGAFRDQPGRSAGSHLPPFTPLGVGQPMRLAARADNLMMVIQPQ